MMETSNTMVVATSLAQFLRAGSDYLGAHKEEIDALNVFPVPDGDTGINMYLTVSSAANKITAGSVAKGISKVADDFALGALMGARGNSGVILSQMFRGFSVGLKGEDSLDAVKLAASMKKGVDLAYKSVMKPVEGTILTVFKELTAAAQEAAASGSGIIEMLEIAIAAGEVALENTPNQLPVLKEAGVVDAGGAGLLCFLKGAMKSIGSAVEYSEIPQVAEPVTQAIPAAASDEISTADIEFAFCTQMLIQGTGLDAEIIREHLSVDPPGDSLLVVGNDEVIKIHFHNNQPWKVLEYCSQFGTLHDIIIDNMVDQHHENKAALDLNVEPNSVPAVSSEPAAPPEPPIDAPKCGVIAVCAGKGMSSLFEEMGATVLCGGQTMNPSAEDILKLVESNPAEEIIILPNNSNIILTASQVKSLSKKKIEVINSKYVTQGLSSMLAFDPDSSAKSNAANMTNTLSDIVNGELTYAIRPAKFNGFNIKEDDILALMNGEIVGCGKKLEKMLTELVAQMVDSYEDSEIIALYWGHNLEEKQADELADKLAKKFPDHEVELYFGGQPLYYFLVSVE